MSVADELIRKALGQLAGDGPAIYRPMLTTGQAVRTPGLEAKLGRMKGGALQTFSEEQFLVWYTGDVLPTADDPAWSAELAGTAAEAVSGGLLTVTADAAGESLLYVFAAPTLSNTRGTTVECNVQIASSDSASNQGSALCIMDGAYQFVVWLRAGGLNVDGAADVPCTLSDRKHRIKFHAKGGGCRVEVDGLLRQTGVWMNETTKNALTFGSWAREDITL